MPSNAAVGGDVDGDVPASLVNAVCVAFVAGKVPESGKRNDSGFSMMIDVGAQMEDRDLEHLRAELKQDLGSFESVLDTKLRDFERRMEVHLEEMQGKMMTAIYRLAETMLVRLADIERSASILKQRLATLEERLTELEKRLNIPPVRTH